MGIGGGTILVPILVYFFHIAQITAQGVIMTIFLPTAAIALYTHYKNGYLRLNIAIYLALGALLGAIIGAFLANNLSNTFLSKIFGIFLITSGLEQLLHKTHTKQK